MGNLMQQKKVELRKIAILPKKYRVNKFDSLIYDFLIHQKQAALEKIGVFEVTSESLNIAHGNEVTSIPKVNFTYDRRATTTAELVDFIAEKLSKNRALIASDLESYFEQVRQFINLGKPYIIPGIGAVSLAKSGAYEFSQQNNEMNAAEEKSARQFYQTDAEQVQESRVKSKNRLAGVAILIVLLLLAGLGWGIYTIFFDKSKQPEVVATPPADSSGATKPATDSVSRKPAEPVTSQAPVANQGDSMVFKFIFETTNVPDRAYSRTAQLRSFGDPAGYDSSVADGQTTYHLYLRKKMTPADTARARDSLQTYFQRKITVTN